MNAVHRLRQHHCRRYIYQKLPWKTLLGRLQTAKTAYAMKEQDTPTNNDVRKVGARVCKVCSGYPQVGT